MDIEAKVFWRKHGTYGRRSVASKVAKMLREPGDQRVRARIVKEVYWRVDYAALRGDAARGQGEGK